MATADRIEISRERYQWALNRAGMTVDDYMVCHPNSNLTKWLEGEKNPTIRQLEDFASSVNVPFGYLFLQNVPDERIPFPVFRGEAGRYNHFDLNVYDMVNILSRRQDWLEDYLKENDIADCEIVGSVTLNTPITETVDRLRKYLDLHANWALNIISVDEAVNKLTDALENAGVFVTFNGVVGNNTHRVLKVSECRGFALANKVAPYIFVNSQDAKTAQMFTLIHETAHLMLGESAGHAATDTLSRDVTENYCDKVAAEFLMPEAELRCLWNSDLSFVARKFKVSELVVARRTHDLKLLSDTAYHSFWNEYITRDIQHKRGTSGGDFYKTTMKRIGRMFAIHVNNAVNSRQLSYTDAYRLTGLSGDTYSKFIYKSL